MPSVHTLAQLKAQLADHRRSLNDLAASTGRLQKTVATLMASSSQAAPRRAKRSSTRPTTSAPRPNRSGVSATLRAADKQDGNDRSSTALERRWGNLF